MLDPSVKPAGDNLELVKLEPEDPPAVLDEGADAQRARRRPGDKMIKKWPILFRLSMIPTILANQRHDQSGMYSTKD